MFGMRRRVVLVGVGEDLENQQAQDEGQFQAQGQIGCWCPARSIVHDNFMLSIFTCAGRKRSFPMGHITHMFCPFHADNDTKGTGESLSIGAEAYLASLMEGYECERHIKTSRERGIILGFGISGW